MSYQWYRIRQVHGRTVVTMIRGAHLANYRVRGKDSGARVAVQMVLSAPGYTSATVWSQRLGIR